MKHPSKWLIFILAAIAQFMVVLDTAITNVALPTIKQQLHFSTTSLQWVVTAYALTFGGFLLLGGRAADLFGRKQTLLMGMLGFTTISILIGGSFFLLTLYIQNILHYSPVLTGISFLPFPITIAYMSTRIPKLVARYGFKRFLIIGPLTAAIGMLWLSMLHASSNYWFGILPGAIITPLGIGMTMMPVIAAATSGVPAHQSGIASGLITTSQQMGGALGLSIISGIAASSTASSLRFGVVQASVHGYHVAFIVSAVLLIFTALVAATVVRSPKRTNEPSEHEQRLHNPQLQSSLH